MMTISEMRITPEMLRQRMARPAAVRPTGESLARMAGMLESYGYRHDNPEVFSAVQSYGALCLDRTAVKGLLLKGECGVGKTAGAEILACIFRWPVMTPSDLSSAWREMDGIETSFRRFVTFGGDPLENPRTIVIDEIGAKDRARNYGEVTDLMALVLDARYQAFVRHGVRTIMTTNLSDADIRQRYGRRIEDRLAEFVWSKRVQGRSLRAEAGTAMQEEK